MRSLQQHIEESLRINKSYKDANKHLSDAWECLTRNCRLTSNESKMYIKLNCNKDLIKKSLYSEYEQLITNIASDYEMINTANSVVSGVRRALDDNKTIMLMSMRGKMFYVEFTRRYEQRKGFYETISIEYYDNKEFTIEYGIINNSNNDEPMSNIIKYDKNGSYMSINNKKFDLLKDMILDKYNSRK